MRAIKFLMPLSLLLFLMLSSIGAMAQNSSLDKPSRAPLRMIVPKDTVKTPPPSAGSTEAEKLMQDMGIEYDTPQMFGLPGGVEDPISAPQAVADSQSKNNKTTSKPNNQRGVAVRTYTSEEIDRLIHPEKNMNREQKFNSFIRAKKLIEPTAVALRSFGLNQIPRYNDESYRIKLEILHSEIPLTYNEYVKIFIDMYVVEKRDQVKRMLSRTDLYFPAIEAALDRHDLPVYLKYLPVMLSALTPHAKSSSGSSVCGNCPMGRLTCMV